ncbi:MAG: hypothetical protein H0W73_05560 [Bacteroidetes bacterium]|nr:hypothetical protein [Bacteroidota bacterium]
MANNTSQHILNTSATLLGFCLFVITSLHMSSKEEHLINLVTSLISVLLTFSCVFSFSSLRTANPKREKNFENIADYLFIVSLFGILAVILLITRTYIK